MAGEALNSSEASADTATAVSLLTETFIRTCPVSTPSATPDSLAGPGADSTVTDSCPLLLPSTP
eukprot:CAMPEP_0181169778 /NCGR_PEP_ID=MMETSP1096-20121128/1001_1 /TAXON_ID=156174 ORGANISM="Chrysochromulina ericina, Strain CCMP281" /NCGR_SAMPLE_ID=MMETSP1096 /ASSEMBLY_ACC=CAM_ASM_000453 /LENGTH=63 /DNA_ID=CAMNT_0023257269 /DNA_START=752 /DNA_END=939 /DNA_ORIENTATION=-